jgi:signal peptidase II
LRSLGDNTVLLSVAGVIVALDQLTKALVTARLAEDRFHALAGSFGLVRRTAGGARFVSLSMRRAVVLWLAVVACLEVAFALGAPLSTAALTGLGLALGGAMGNVVDRLVRGGVVDFIALARWPTFNLADAAMVCGVGVATWSLL